MSQSCWGCLKVKKLVVLYNYDDTKFNITNLLERSKFVLLSSLTYLLLLYLNIQTCSLGQELICVSRVGTLAHDLGTSVSWEMSMDMFGAIDFVYIKFVLRYVATGARIR